MVYLLRARASGWSLRIVLAAWWGRSLLRGEAVCPSPSVLTPYSPGHASTTMWRGWEGGGDEVVEGGGGGSWPLPPSRSFLPDALLSPSQVAERQPRPRPRPAPPTKCCNLTSLTKGKIDEQD